MLLHPGCDAISAIGAPSRTLVQLLGTSAPDPGRENCAFAAMMPICWQALESLLRRISGRILAEKKNLEFFENGFLRGSDSGGGARSNGLETLPTPKPGSNRRRRRRSPGRSRSRAGTVESLARSRRSACSGLGSGLHSREAPGPVLPVAFGRQQGRCARQRREKRPSETFSPPNVLFRPYLVLAVEAIEVEGRAAAPLAALPGTT